MKKSSALTIHTVNLKEMLSPLTRNTWQHNSPNLDQTPNMHVGTVLICNVRGRKKMYEVGKNNIIKPDLQAHATKIYFS